MPQQASLATKAGIVILAGVVLLVGFSLRSTGRNWFYEGYEVSAEFDTAKGIEPGSQVVLAGVPIGQVSRLQIVPDARRIRLTLLIDQERRIAEDAVASIRLRTLLGNYHIYINHGSPQAPALQAGDSLQTETYADITETLQELGEAAGGLGKIGEGSEGVFASIQGDTEELFEKLNEMVEENRDNLLKTTESFAEAGQSFQDAGPKFNELLDRMLELASGLQEGEGTIGKLAQSDEVYEQILDVTTNLQQFSHDLNASSGTLAMLVHDEELGRKVAETFDNVNAASGKIRALIDRNDERIDQALESVGEAMPKLNQGLDHFVSIGRKIDEGEGTLGKLVNDPELYDSVRDAVNQIRRTFEEGEEQTVMRTFLGVFFGSVI